MVPTGSPALPAWHLPAQKALHIRACAWAAKPHCHPQRCGNSHLCCPHRPVPAWEAPSRDRCLPGIDRAWDRQFFQGKHELMGRQSLPPPQSCVAKHQTKANLAKIKRSGWIFQVATLKTPFPLSASGLFLPIPVSTQPPSSKQESAGGLCPGRPVGSAGGCRTRVEGRSAGKEPAALQRGWPR